MKLLSLLWVFLIHSDSIENQHLNVFSKQKHAWYLVQIDDFQKLRKVANDAFFVSKGLYSAYLAQEVAERLNQQPGSSVKKITSKFKGKAENKGDFLVIASEKCEHGCDVISKDSYFHVLHCNSSNAAKLHKVACIRAFERFESHVELKSRFSKQLTLGKYDANAVFSTLPARIHGLTGEGECAAVADSGLDADSPWFKDSKHPRLLDSMHFRHEHVKMYLPYADDKDADGHGTFISGIIAGSTNCSSEAAQYNGIAPKAKLVVQDVVSNVTSLPANLSELVYVAGRFNCSVQLNAWTVPNQKLLRFYFDLIAYNNPDVLMVFPQSPIGEASNVLSVGSVFSHPSTDAVINRESPVLVYATGLQRPIPAVTTEHGPPLLNSSFNINEKYFIGETASLGIKKGSSLALIFGDDAPTKKSKVPVIRLPERWRDPFVEGLEIHVTPMGSTYSFNEPRNSPNSYKTKNPFLIKPEVVAPGGPVVGPSAGATECSTASLEVREGDSIASAFVTGDILLLSQFVRKKFFIKPRSSLLRALIVASAVDSLTDQSSTPREVGFGRPCLGCLINSSLFVFQDITLQEKDQYVLSFKATANGPLTVVLSWLEYPRDPDSPVLTTTSIQASIIDVNRAAGSNTVALPNQNINTDDLIYENFNPTLKLSANLTLGHVYYLVIKCSRIEVVSTVNISLVVSGAVSKPIKHLKPVDTSCPKPCMNNGQCINGQCQCSEMFIGNQCKESIKMLNSGDTVAIVSQSPKSWSIFSFILPKWREGCSIVIKYSNLDTRHQGVFLNYNSPPTPSNFMCTNEHCRWGSVRDDSITIEYNHDWDFMESRDPIFIGLYTYKNTRSNVSMTVEFVE